MVRRRWAAVVGLLSCLLLLHLVVPGPAGDGPVTAVAVTAAADAAGAASSAEGEAAGEPCPCEEEPSVRQFVARTPRAAGAAGVSAVVAGAPGVGRGGTDVRASGPGRCRGTCAAAPRAVELQAFRC
ncbi:hypothetical protein [Streptomyces sp. NPDC002788]